MYIPDPQSGIAHPSGVLVFSLSGDRVSAITRFDATVLPCFRVPPILPRQPRAHCPLAIASVAW